MKQAQEMQARLEQDLATLEVESSSGGGMVKVGMNGKKELLSVTIDPEILGGDDAEMLGDLILAAVNDAARKVDEAVQSKMGSLGAGLPGLF